jgi:hypothetical protein
MKTRKAGNKIEQKKGTERGRVVNRKDEKRRGYKEEGRKRKSRRAGNRKDGKKEERGKIERMTKNQREGRTASKSPH